MFLFYNLILFLITLAGGSIPLWSRSWSEQRMKYLLAFSGAFLLSITMLHLIPETVELEGTFRTFDEVWRKEAKTLIRNIAEQIAAAYGAEAIVDIPEGYPSLYNNPELTAQANSFATEYLGDENVKALDKRMGAEDFSFYTHHTPGCFYRIGTNHNNEAYMAPVHNPRFDIDELALETGAGLMSWLGLQVLQSRL